MDPSAFQYYLQRIRVDNIPDADLQSLQKLQRQHLLNIPFENLDIHEKIPITLDIDRIFNKIIMQKRGGFCYELNALFNELLKQTGFQTALLSARVYEDHEKFGMEYDHLCILVTIDDQQWLADVGFGEFSISPLLIKLNEIQVNSRGHFVIRKYDEQYLVVEKMKPDGSWKPEYIFSIIPRALAEFREMLNYHQTSPLSHFTQKRICSLATEEGRISLSDNTFKITKGNEVTEIPIVHEKTFNELLKEHFGISWHTSIPG